ncbi:MAG: VCBS repeat-containing protein, partial [Kofleriaceae bacterium]|nr:VCBS repeat-containing protein [Kofleriaceae bacterium]
MKHRLGWLLFVGGVSSAAVLLVTGSQETKPVVAQSADDSCPATSSPTTQTGTTLETFATDSNSGVIYDSSGAGRLEIQKAGGLFKSTNFSLASDAHGLCTADFDNDGWVEIMSTSYDGGDLVLSLNKTIDNQISPNWADPNYVTTPKFVASYYIAQNCSGRNGHPNLSKCGSSGNEALGCADFNGDGNADFLFVRQRNSDSSSGVPHRATLYLGNGDGTFQNGYEAGTASEFKYIVKSTTLLPVDYNGDGRLDLLVGGASVSKVETRGQVQLFLNDGATPPNFVQATPLVTNADFGRNGINTLAFNDFTGDGVDDLLITSTHRRKIHIYPGLASGGLQATYIDVTNDYPGAAAMVLGADFSLDGQADMMLASDNYGYGSSLGGYTHYYTNNGTANPFSGGIQQTLTTYGNPDTDFDMAAVIQYDNDPDGTPDFVVANGNGSNTYQIFANRAIGQYNACGEVQSGVLSLGALAAEDMVVTAARIAPDMTLPSGTTVVFEMSNEIPENWVVASPCSDDPTEFCASFPQPVGRDVKWKATLCANSALTLTPSITGVDVTFDYTELDEHYRSGVVVDDGIAYVGAF